jgi:hypothetical protein
MSPQLSKKRAILACSAQAAFPNLPFFCPNNSCDAEVPKEIFYIDSTHFFPLFVSNFLSGWNG